MHPRASSNAETRQAWLITSRLQGSSFRVQVPTGTLVPTEHRDPNCGEISTTLLPLAFAFAFATKIIKLAPPAFPFATFATVASVASLAAKVVEITALAHAFAEVALAAKVALAVLVEDTLASALAHRTTKIGLRALTTAFHGFAFPVFETFVVIRVIPHFLSIDHRQKLIMGQAERLKKLRDISMTHEPLPLQLLGSKHGQERLHHFIFVPLVQNLCWHLWHLWQSRLLLCLHPLLRCLLCAPAPAHRTRMPELPSEEGWVGGYHHTLLSTARGHQAAASQGRTHLANTMPGLRIESHGFESEMP
mmetsp:Transcript_112099/g.222800  ORF Transcript_112099/g.222800 Transcript_112099/m.222800 type:complete len:306 (-) Transcript_112099:7-924(-)